MKKIKLIGFCSLFLVGLCLFFGCDSAVTLTEPVLNALERGSESRYTGVLHRVGSVELFRCGANDPIALEWNGTDLYMIAEFGYYPSEGEYLFRIDRETGIGEMVNAGARDLGGSFTQGRTFTQVKGVSVSDLAWSGVDSGLFGTWLRNEIVVVDIDSGLAGRGAGKLSFCFEERDRNPVPYAISHDGFGFYMLSGTRNSDDKKILELTEINGQCVSLVVEVWNLEFGSDLRPIAMCWDGKGMYVSEMHTRSLCILDLETGILSPVDFWTYASIPPGHYIQDKHTAKDTGFTEMPLDHDGKNYFYVNRARNVGFDFPDITGIAFDGQDMYAVDYFTDALYRVGRD